jgi:hypothetical protein
MKKYCVHFSEEDLYYSEGTYGRMNVNIQPAPVPGNFLVKPDGIYEIDTAYMCSMDMYWDIYLTPVECQCEDGDTILILDKERMYKCHKNKNEYGFKKVTLYTLMCAIDELSTKVSLLNEKLEQVDTK